MIERDTERRSTGRQRGRAGPATARTDPSQLLQDIQIDPVGVLLGPGLEDLCREPLDARLAELVDDLRHRLAYELGIVLPPVRFTLEPGLLSGAYRIVVDGDAVAESMAPAGRVMVIGGADDDPDAIPTTEPVFGLPVTWVRADSTEPLCGTSMATREQAITAHLAEVARTHAPALLSRDDVADLVDAVRRRHPASTEEVDAGLLPLAVLHALLRDLLASGSSIRNLRRILDELAPALMQGVGYDSLVEIARLAVRP